MVTEDTTPYTLRIKNSVVSKLQASGIGIQKYIQTILEDSTLEKAELDKLIFQKRMELDHLEKLRQMNGRDIFNLNPEEKEALNSARAVIEQKGNAKFSGQLKLFNNRFGRDFTPAVFRKLLGEK